MLQRCAVGSLAWRELARDRSADAGGRRNGCVAIVGLLATIVDRGEVSCYGKRGRA